MLPTPDKLSVELVNPTVTTWLKVDHLLQYIASHRDAIIRFKVSNMVIYIYIYPFG